MHIDEVFAVFTLLYVDPLKSNLEAETIRQRFDADDLAFCDDILVKVSRSFAAVIRQLPDATLVDILVFYLVLRALDTLEDDMFAYESVEQKVKMLQEFHTKALEDPNWCVDGIGEGDEKRLLQEFPKCHRIYAALAPESRKVIADITKRMAFGMAEFVGKDLGQGTLNIEEYNRYCHFVAGLVGEGLSRLFAATKLESPSFANETHLSNQMGLFLQKTNIIRDYLEDYVDKRAFWPQSVWKKYSESGDLGYFTNQSDPEVQRKSVECLNELVTDALELVPDCLAYMEKLRCSEVFRFCAIPQVMAIATLDKLYANADVFTGVVKIRKGLSCKLILHTNSVEELHEIFYNFALSVKVKAEKERKKGVKDPSYERTLRACETILALTREKAASRSLAQTSKWMTLGGFVTAAIWTKRSPSTLNRVDSQWNSLIQAGLVTAGVALYWFGPWNSKSNLRPAREIVRKV